MESGRPLNARIGGSVGKVMATVEFYSFNFIVLWLIVLDGSKTMAYMIFDNISYSRIIVRILQIKMEYYFPNESFDTFKLGHYKFDNISFFT